MSKVIDEKFNHDIQYYNRYQGSATQFKVIYTTLMQITYTNLIQINNTLPDIPKD